MARELFIAYTLIALIVSYMMIALVIFGYAATNTKVCDMAEEPQGCKAIVGIVSAATWPMYLSWLAFEEDN